MFAQRFARLVGPALIVGGLLWVTDFGIIFISGLMTGTLPNIPDAHSPLFLRIGIRLFALSALVLGIGLLAMFAQLRGRSKGFGIPSAVFAVVAIVMTSINLVLLSGISGTPTFLGNIEGLAIIGASLSALFMGIAVLRVHLYPRWIGVVLIAIGVLTFPILIVTPFPIAPTWATDHLAFLLSGTAFTTVGIGALTGQKMLEPIRPALATVGSQE